MTIEIFRCPVPSCPQIDMTPELAAVHAAEHADQVWVAKDAVWRREAREGWERLKQKRGET